MKLNGLNLHYKNVKIEGSFSMIAQPQPELWPKDLWADESFRQVSVEFRLVLVEFGLVKVEFWQVKLEFGQVSVEFGQVKVEYR